MAMYMAMTAQIEADARGYVVLVRARASQRDGCIWHWQSNPTKLVSLPVRVLTGRPYQPEQPLWDEHFLDTTEV